MSFFKKLRMGVGALSVILAGTAVTGTQAHAMSAPSYGNSPLFSTSMSAHARINAIANAMRNAGGGTPTTQSIQQAVKLARNAHPDAPLSLFAAALNRLNMGTEAMAKAVTYVSDSYGVPKSEVVGHIITDTYTTQGFDAAKDQIANLKDSVGSGAVNDALGNVPGDLKTADNDPGGNTSSSIGGPYNG